MNTAKASSPGHITGLFQICNDTSNPLNKGSKGAGISLRRGVETRVTIEEKPQNSIEIQFNGHKTKSANVSFFLANQLLKKFSDPVRLIIDHNFDIPIGAGFGSSGAGALSLALALNKVLDLGLSKLEAAQEAHIAEICCGTGLGTVIAEYFGGLELRSEPGGPGIGIVHQIPVQEDYVVVVLNFKSLSTRKLLASTSLRKIINSAASKYVKILRRDSTLQNFLKFSRKFAEETGLITGRIRDALCETDKEGFVCSMPMFGNGVFSVISPERVPMMLEMLKKYEPSAKIFTSQIDFDGAKLH
jgi:pantoate kinase